MSFIAKKVGYIAKKVGYIVMSVKQQLSPISNGRSPEPKATKETGKKIYMRLGDEPKQEKTRNELLAEFQQSTNNMRENLRKMSNGLSSEQIQKIQDEIKQEQSKKSSQNYRDFSR